MRCDRDRHVSNCGCALQFWLVSQPGLDTRAAPMGNPVRLDGTISVCGIDYRFGHHVAVCGSSKSPFAHRLAESVHDLDVCVMADGRRLVSRISQEGVAQKSSTWSPAQAATRVTRGCTRLAPLALRQGSIGEDSGVRVRPLHKRCRPDRHPRAV
jgi:hypothetical protein